MQAHPKEGISIEPQKSPADFSMVNQMLHIKGAFGLLFKKVICISAAEIHLLQVRIPYGEEDPCEF